MNFELFKATKKLRELSKDAPDLTVSGTLNPQRIDQMIVSSCNLRLFFATERVNEEIIDTLCALADEAQAHRKMQSIQNLEMVNYIRGYASENRSAGHTTLRAFFDKDHLSPEAQAAAEEARIEIEKLRHFCHKAHGKYSDVIVIGIGGSYLGTSAVYNALKAYQTTKCQLHFISNVDPDNTAAILKEIELSNTLVVVVSKSGTTLEITSNEELLREQFSAAGLYPKDHFVCVTGKGSPMDDPSHYLASFYMWDYVGGRYSVSSMVGMCPLSLTLGFDVMWDFLQGMHTMDAHALEKDPWKNMPLMSALLDVWNRNFLLYPNLAVIPYAYGMSRWSAHLQQLVMESNGKHISQDGSWISYPTSAVIFGEPGTDCQHSFFQCLHQGTDIVPIEFIGFKDSQYGLDATIMETTQREKLNANLFAQSIALATGKKDDNRNKHFAGNRPTRIVFAKQLTPSILGQLLAYYEHKTAFTGTIWQINSFDQEGVQLGKKLALSILDLYKQQNKRKGTAPHPGQKELPIAEAFIRHTENLEVPHARSVSATPKRRAQ